MEHAMSDETQNPNVKANNNSTAVGNVHIDGSVGGSLVIGNQNNAVSVGNISNVSGNVNIAGGNIETHQTSGISAAELKQLFDGLYSSIDARANTTSALKEDLKAEVQEIQTQVTEAASKNEKLEESSLSRHFRNIARMAPDILDVAVASLANPLAGLGVAAAKIAQKAKEDIGSA
jgi:hypothetical protein